MKTDEFAAIVPYRGTSEDDAASYVALKMAFDAIYEKRGRIVSPLRREIFTSEDPSQYGQIRYSVDVEFED